MKIIKIVAVCLTCVTALFLSSCGKTTLPPEMKTVPDKAFFVVDFATKQIASKGELNKPETYKSFAKIQKEMADIDNPNAKMMIEKLLKDPKSIGLQGEHLIVYGAVQSPAVVDSVPYKGYDWDNDSAYIAYRVEADSIYFGVVTALSDGDKFEASLKTLFSDDDNAKIKDNGTYKEIVDSETIFAWNKEFCMVFLGKSARKTLDLTKFFFRNEEQSIAANADFVEFYDKQFDIGTWLDYSQIEQFADVLGSIPMGGLAGLMLNRNKASDPTSSDKEKKAYIHAYLDFNDGEIKYSQNMSDGYVENFGKTYKRFDKTLLNDFPKESFMMLQYSLNMEEFTKILLSDSRYADFSKDNEARMVVNALSGDALLDVFGFSQGTPIPLVGLDFTVKSKESFDSLRTVILKDVNVVDEGDHYTVPLVVVTIQFAYKDGRVFVTNDEAQMKAFLKGGSGKTLANSEVGKLTKDAGGSWYINLDIDSYPESLRALMQTYSQEKYQPIHRFLEPFRDFSATSNSKNGEMRLRFKTNDNSLKQLLHSIDEFAIAVEENQ